MVEYKRGDIVRAQGRRGKYRLRSPCANGDGWWAISLATNRLRPIRIKEKR